MIEHVTTERVMAARARERTWYAAFVVSLAVNELVGNPGVTFAGLLMLAFLAILEALRARHDRDRIRNQETLAVARVVRPHGDPLNIDFH